MDKVGVTEKYKSKQSYECLNGCWTGFLCLAGYELEACDIFFGGSGYHLRLNYNFGQFRSNIARANYDFMERNGISFIKKCVSKFAGKLDFITYCLENQQCLSIRVEAILLTYCKALQQTEDAPHYINILQIDEAKQMVYIADADITTLTPSVFEGWVDLDMIIKAWKRQKYEYHMIQFEDIVLDEKKVKQDTLEGAIDAINEYIQGGLDFDGMPFGFTAVKELFILLDKLFYSNHSQFNVIAKNLNYQLKTGGFIGQKYFLEQLIVREHLSKKLVDDYQVIINEWNICCLLLVKIGMAPSEKLLHKLHEKAEETLEKEIECMKQIRQELEKREEINEEKITNQYESRSSLL